MENYPFISLVIATKNEEEYIEQCLDSLVRNDYPQEKMEIILVDGLSKDKTRRIINNYSEKYSFIRVMDNPKIIAASAWNIGIRESRGDLVAIMGAHAFYSDNYIKKCVESSVKYDADLLGGTVKPVSKNNTITNKAIVLALGGRFGKGKKEKRKKALRVDTVFSGFYKRELFEEIGFFDERLKRSADMDFSIRMRKKNKEIIQISDAISYYYPKTNIKDLLSHNIKDGVWALLPYKYTGRPLKLRHYIPLIFILTLPLSIWPYIIVSLYFSLKISIREKNWKYFFVMPVVFGVRHISYGLGSLWGLIRLMI